MTRQGIAKYTFSMIVLNVIGLLMLINDGEADFYTFWSVFNLGLAYYGLTLKK